VIHNNFTNNVHYVLLSPPSPGVIPAGIKNLVKLTTLLLRDSKVSGTCGGSAPVRFLDYGFPRKMIVVAVLSADH
jgi:hypothetical protein